MAEVLGRNHMASQVVNCSAPDTGNMGLVNSSCIVEFIAYHVKCRGFGKIWLTSTAEEMAGTFTKWRHSIRICYDGKTWSEHSNFASLYIFIHSLVASSDATNITTSIKREGDEIVINGHKW